jgi:hypothetical protein
VITSSLAVLVAVGTAIGFLAGRAYQVAHRAWSDYKKTQALIPELQKAFWLAVRAAIVIVTVALVWMVGSVWVAGATSRGPSPVAVAVGPHSLTVIAE